MGDVVRCVVLKPVAHVSTEWIGPGLSSAQQPLPPSTLGPKHSLMQI